MKSDKAFYILVVMTLCSCAFCLDLCHASNNLKSIKYENALKTSVKRYVVYPYKNDKILCEPYRVSKNDWLYKIFRKKGDISEKDFPLFINMFRTINPGINNIDAIHPGQRILIPLKKIHKNDFKETRPGVVDVPVIEFTHIPEGLKPFIERHRIKKGESVSRLLNTIFLNRDGTLNAQGMRAFKLVNPHIKDVNLIYAGSFINLPSTSICLQPWFRSSSSIAHSVTKTLPGNNAPKQKAKKPSGKRQNDKAVARQESRIRSEYSLQSILKGYAALEKGRVLKTGKFYFPSDHHSDFVLDLKSTPVIELASGGKILIVPDKKTGTALSGIINSFWKNIKVLTVPGAVRNLKKHHPEFTGRKLKNHINRDKLLVTNPAKRLAADAEKTFLPLDHEAAIQKLLGFTDFHYIPDSQISLAMGSVHFNVSLGRILKKGSPDLLVDFGTIYGYAFDIIRKQGFKIISFSPKSTLKDAMLKLFAYIGMPVTRDPVFVSTKTKKAITIHGLYATDNIHDLLISEEQLDKETAAFLNRKNIKILYFQTHNSRENIK